jgi:hypothetical protein
MPRPRLKTYSIIALALTTCAAAALAWSLYLQVIRLRAAALDDPAKADLQKRLWDLEKRNKDLETQLANRRARETGVADEAGNPETPGGTPAAGRPGGRFNRRGGFANIATLLDNPKFNQLWTQEQKDRVKLAYADLFKHLNLTPDQADKLNSLLVERQESVMDVLSAAREQGIYGRDQIGSLIQQANASVDTQIQSLLGPDGYAQYNGYLQTMPQRNQVNELQTRLTAAGLPQLQPYQTDQLTQILAQSTATDGSGGGGRGGGPMGQVLGGLFGGNVTGPTISPSAVSQAAAVLTAEQQQALQQMQQQQAAQQQIMSLMRQTFRNGGQAPASGAAAGAPAATAPPPRGG